MREPVRIVLGLEAHDVAEEVMHFLDRSGRARVIASATDERQLTEAIRQLEPDAVVATPMLAGATGGMNGSVLLAVDTSESVQSLRSAIRAGAAGFYLWPADREELVRAAVRALPPADPARTKRAPLIAVYGARGGVGTTFVATHLAAAFARGGDCVMVDLDIDFADVTSALGVPAEPPTRTVADAVPLGDELSPEHLERLLWRHESGLRVLLAPREVPATTQVRAADYRAAIGAARATTDVVVIHVPRMLNDVSRTGLEMASLVLMVLCLDVASFRDTKRALASLAAAGVEGRCAFVVNRAGRSDITPKDVGRAFGRPPIAVLPTERTAPGAQNRGTLLPPRNRTARAVDRLARRLLEAAP